MTRYYARSAADAMTDWPFWCVADREKGGLNVTADLARDVLNLDPEGGVLLSCGEAEELAERANEKLEGIG